MTESSTTPAPEGANAWSQLVGSYLIDRRIVFLTHWFPGHNNPGDWLLYEGAHQLFRKLNCRVMGEITGEMPPEAVDAYPEDVQLVVSGGGNLGGALYPRDGLLGARAAARHPERASLFMPQTYLTPWQEENRALLARLVARDNTTFFLREATSLYYFQKDYGKGWCQPDVVDQFFEVAPPPQRAGVLRIARQDAERELRFPGEDWSDWPTDSLIARMSPYAEVMSDRLHAAILARRLGAKVWFVANSYYKNESYYRTWWAQDPAVTFLSDQAAVDACLAAMG